MSYHASGRGLKIHCFHLIASIASRLTGEEEGQQGFTGERERERELREVIAIGAMRPPREWAAKKKRRRRNESFNYRKREHEGWLHGTWKSVFLGQCYFFAKYFQLSSAWAFL